MNNFTSVVEIQNKFIRIFVGYLIENKLKVVYAKENELTIPFKDGDIIDIGSLSSDISKICQIKADELGYKCNVNDVIVVIPPYGLEVFGSTKMTNTTSQESRINPIDIQNLFSLVKKEPIDSNRKIINILPKRFVLEDGKEIFSSPIGSYSNSISLDAFVYVLPKKIFDDINKAFKNASIRISNILVSSLCEVEEITNLNSKFNNYVLVNYNERNTILSLVNNKKVLSCTYFFYGSDHLVKSIESNFKIKTDEARKLIDVFGSDSSKYNYNPPLCDNTDEITKMYSKNNLSIFVNEYFKERGNYLNNAIKTLFSDDYQYAVNIPFILVGTGFKVNGFKEYLTRILPNNTIDFLKNNIVGLDLGRFLGLAGAIYLNDKLKNYFKDNLNDTKGNSTSKKDGGLKA